MDDAGAVDGPDGLDVGAGVRVDSAAVAALTAALAVPLWASMGGLGLAVAQGSGARESVGLALVACYVLALWCRRAVADGLWHWPWIACSVSVATVCLSAAGGILDSPYLVLTAISLWLPVVVARTRTVWLCILLMDLAYVGFTLAGYDRTTLAQQQAAGHIASALSAYPMFGLLLLCLRRVFRRYSEDTEAVLAPVYQCATKLPLALQHAVARDAPASGLPVAMDVLEGLTTTERRVIKALATGSAPKQLSQAWGVSLATVRTHIQNIKRKTGARTLRELAALWALSPSREDEAGD